MNKVFETTLKYPVLFTCNVRRSVFESFGLTHWKHLKYHGLQIVPVITDQSSGIETRADILKKNIMKMLDKLGVDKAHIVSHSLSGIDARYAIASLGLSNRVYSLTTIATPHR
jgi:triacylglycerol esterase/lipase EstA (alpha/beta hydrolase family)